MCSQKAEERETSSADFVWKIVLAAPPDSTALCANGVGVESWASEDFVGSCCLLLICHSLWCLTLEPLTVTSSTECSKTNDLNLAAPSRLLRSQILSSSIVVSVDDGIYHPHPCSADDFCQLPSNRNLLNSVCAAPFAQYRFQGALSRNWSLCSWWTLSHTSLRHVHCKPCQRCKQWIFLRLCADVSLLPGCCFGLICHF